MRSTLVCDSGKEEEKPRRPKNIMDCFLGLERAVRFTVTLWFVPGTDMGDGAIDTFLKS